MDLGGSSTSSDVRPVEKAFKAAIKFVIVFVVFLKLLRLCYFLFIKFILNMYPTMRGLAQQGT